MTERYKVVCNKVAIFTTEELTAWFEVYCTDYNDHTDMHQLFADKLGVTRQQAKELAHKIAWKGCKGMVNLGHYIGRIK